MNRTIHLTDNYSKGAPIPFPDTIMFYFNTIDKHISSYRNMISSLLPDYKQNGNCFSKAVTEETIEDEIISLVKRLKK